VEFFQIKHRNIRHDDNSKQTTSREEEAKMISPEFPYKKAVTLLGIEVVQLIWQKWIFLNGPH
jgi:hypothetical protein